MRRSNARRKTPRRVLYNPRGGMLSGWIRFSFVASGRYLLEVREIGRIVRVCYPDCIPDNTP